MVSYVSDNGWKVLDIYDYHSVSLPLEFTVDPTETNMFKWLGTKAHLFESNNLTYNSHKWGMNPNRF